MGWGEQQSIFIKSGTRQRCLIFTLIFNSLEVLDTSIGQEMETGMQIGKEEIKVSLYVDDMVQYHKRSKSLHRKTLMRNNFSKVSQ